jgi:hypothetical protein
MLKITTNSILALVVLIIAIIFRKDKKGRLPLPLPDFENLTII